MRSIIFLAMFGTLLLLPAVGFAETNAECATRCGAEKATRDAACPPPAYDGDPVRTQCIQESQDAFSNCLAGCPQPEPPTDMPPAEKTE